MEDIPSIPNPAPSTSAKDVLDNRLLAALSWLWILSVVILLVKKDSPFVQHHARQSFLLFIVSVVLWLVAALFGPLAWVVHWLLSLAVFVIVVIGFIKALGGKWWTLPVLGPLASKVRL